MLPKLPLAHQHIAHARRRSSLASSRSSPEDGSRPGTPSQEDEDVDPDQGNVLSSLIAQLRPGADLSRVVLPTFILEPRSMLERITNFMAHPETLLPMSQIDDPLERFVSVIRFYLSGWHIKPPGVKKPLNPILGEIFTSYWDYEDGTRGYYISEQTSHHPPKSSYFFMAPEHHIRIDGTLKPRGRFLGNSAASMMEGIAVLQFLNRGTEGRGERYHVTQPNMYARGILWGKMKYELGDHSFVRCPENDLIADIDFKTRGYFSGTYNAIGGTIRNEKTGEIFYELSGLWNGEMFIKDVVTGQKELLFNARHAKHTPPLSRPIEEQEERESQRLWHNTVLALYDKNHQVATAEKTKIEERQRVEASTRAQEGLQWHPRLFRPVRGGPGGSEEGEEDLDWILNANIDSHNPTLAAQQILAVYPILKGQEVSHEFDIPPHHSQQSGTSTSTPAEATSQRPGQNNLIDFDDDPPSTTANSTQNSSGALVDLGNEKDEHSKTSDAAGMMAPLQPNTSAQQGRPLKRRDSDASDMDIFVDAQD
ncbi:hypothetical protein AJ80_07811 [Polytolypa hystricis UAMH7299]|uniref:Oxysterol-binding protein n=1 Tax=Polytolypa hystricis (strain UAMH7299) TaxID=1447883 RepID=A0A2B7XID3_POLH7|nr:hypothetical protein AJ80_07811 [Polytolypa hystricis UAMH7299]